MILRVWTLLIFYVQSEKMDGSFLKDTKDYRSFYDFLPTSTIHNSLKFWIFLMVLVSKLHSIDILHAIFFGQEQIPSGRPCLDTRHYKSFLKKKLRNFLSMKSQPFSSNFNSTQLLAQASNWSHSLHIVKLMTLSFKCFKNNIIWCPTLLVPWLWR